LVSHESTSRERTLVSMTAYGGFCGENQCFAAFADGGSCVCTGFDHADHRHGNGTLDVVKSESAGRSAADDQQVESKAFEIFRRLDRVLRNCLARFGSVRKPRGVAKIKVVGIADFVCQCPKHGQPTDAGIENSDAKPFAL